MPLIDITLISVAIERGEEYWAGGDSGKFCNILSVGKKPTQFNQVHGRFTLLPSFYFYYFFLIMCS